MYPTESSDTTTLCRVVWICGHTGSRSVLTDSCIVPIPMHNIGNGRGDLLRRFRASCDGVGFKGQLDAG